MSSPRFEPWLMPEMISSGRSPRRPSSAKRTQSTGVPSVAKPLDPSSNSISSTQSGERVVMLRAVALRFELGAITCTSTSRRSRSLSRRAFRPLAPMPSSLVIRTRITSILGASPRVLCDGLPAAEGDDHLGRDAQEDARAEHQEAELAMAQLPHRGPHLADHVED